MRKQRPVGLVVEGNATASPLLALRGVADEIGPVKSTSLRVARRLSNVLRAGRGVNAYEDLQEAGLVLLRIPDSSLPRVIEELCAAELPLSEMSVVACETWITNAVLDRLEERGASVATLTTVPGTAGNWFVAEGGARAIRLTRRLLESSGGKVFQVRPGGRSLYFAAGLLTTVMPLPFLTAAQGALREAGISGRLLSTLMDQLSGKMMRNFKAGTRLSRQTALGLCPEDVAREHLEQLEMNAPEIAVLISAHLAQSVASAKLK